ncbi:hypothetical protein DPEC_G00067780 [Dallia pectoralis]|uniref:Uncharacterized protein n=1 Tax=Dallia pectoralis TaxID=75939 RepID=A0ACC2H1I5_DALPE|nr:hypothetical protein DPEC_G00067780 [Dallia pectoralis]
MCHRRLITQALTMWWTIFRARCHDARSSRDCLSNHPASQGTTTRGKGAQQLDGHWKSGAWVGRALSPATLLAVQGVHRDSFRAPRECKSDVTGYEPWDSSEPYTDTPATAARCRL